MQDKVQYPTVGRIVHYHDPDHVEPFAGIVAVANANRYTIPVLHVFLHDGARVVNDIKHKDCVKLARGEAYWDWMDYQKGQAAKTEALQAELDAKSRQQVHEARFQKMGQPAPPNPDYDRELTKNQASTPSREDGKR